MVFSIQYSVFSTKISGRKLKQNSYVSCELLIGSLADLKVLLHKLQGHFLRDPMCPPPLRGYFYHKVTESIE
jgi:hypothetical protein